MPTNLCSITQEVVRSLYLTLLSSLLVINFIILSSRVNIIWLCINFMLFFKLSVANLFFGFSFLQRIDKEKIIVQIFRDSKYCSQNGDRVL